jgi:EpsI family protein
MKQSVRVGVSLSLLIGALLVLHLRSSGEAVPLRKSLDSFPLEVGQWQAREGVLLELDILVVLKAKDYLMRRDQDPAGKSVWLFIAYWDSQRKGAQPHSPKNCLPGSGWEPLEASSVTIPLSSAFAPITVNRYLIQKDQDQQIVFYWYQSQGRAIAGEVAARVEMVKNSIMRHRTDGALVRVSSPVYGNVQDSSDRLVRYIQALYPVLGNYLPD